MATKRFGGSGRRRSALGRREAEWRRVLAEQAQSGMSQAAFCRERSISANTFSWWKREIARRDRSRRDVGPAGRAGRIDSRRPAPALVPVRMSAGFGPAAGFEVVLDGRRTIRVPAGFDAVSLSRLVAVLEGGARC